MRELRPFAGMPDRDVTSRLFLAVPIPAEVRRELAACLRTARTALPGKPVPPANWHLTIRFLGEVQPPTADLLVARLAGAELGPAFDVGLSSCGAFPRPSRATVLWVGVDDGADRLRSLGAAVEAAVREVGFPAERRPFHPHLTISRLRTPTDVRGILRALPPPDVRFRADRLVLYRSVLGGGPPRYESLESFALPPEH